MADKDVKYVSLTGLQEFYTKLKADLALANGASGKVLTTAYATAAGSATQDSAGNNISTTYIKQIDFTPSGGDNTQPTHLTPTSGAVTLDLSGYALKSEVANVMEYKGSKTGAQLAAIKTGTITADLNGDVYTCSDAATSPYKQDYEYVAVVSGTAPSLTLDWVELGKWFEVDISGKADKVSGATNGNLAGLDANGNLTDSGVAASKLAGTGAVADSDENFVTGDTVYDYVNDSNHHLLNTIESITINGASTGVSVSNKVADLTVPVAASSIADNETGYATGDQVYDYVANSNNVTKVWDSSATPVHVNNLTEASNSEIDGLFV